MHQQLCPLKANRSTVSSRFDNLNPVNQELTRIDRSQLFVICSSCFVLFLSLVGCNYAPSDRPELGQVSGTVKLDGKPVALVNVTFLPEEGRGSTGQTDESGAYTLSYTDSLQGAKVGEHTVQITVDEGSTTLIPAKYNSTSTLKREVKPGKNEIHFELDSQ